MCVCLCSQSLCSQFFSKLEYEIVEIIFYIKKKLNWNKNERNRPGKLHMLSIGKANEMKGISTIFFIRTSVMGDKDETIFHFVAW